jgi:CHAD domain-containing protein
MRDLDDLFAALAKSRFRAQQRLNARDALYLRDKGLATVMDHARDFVAQRLAAAQPANDGKQTPWKGHPVFVAQHATACCCRSCLSKWHGIAKGHELTDGERAHVLAALERWLRAQSA